MAKLWRGAAAIAIVLVSLVGLAATSSAAANCSPGQHGNPHPGFKPGAC